jgi:muramoyltetrapeptide carboxypeptidase
MVIPQKLKAGDDVRIIAPSCTVPSMPWFSDAMMADAKKFFIDRGITVSEGKYIREMDGAGSTTIEHRIEDIHAAYGDPSVRALLCMRGGWNCNQLLPFLDYDLIKKHPKIFCGFSDITALSNAIFAKTGVVAYSGPNFNQFAYGDKIRFAYDAFTAALMNDEPFTLQSSKEWTDAYFAAGKPWPFDLNEGWWAVHEGEAEGTSIGGNLCTLSLLQGTEYMPQVNGSILFIEDDHETHPRTFDRDLTSLTQQPWFDGVKGIIVGRCQREAVNAEFGPVTKETLLQIIERNPRLNKLPIIANADFGHTYPTFTFPIGGTVKMRASKEGSEIEIVKH